MAEPLERMFVPFGELKPDGRLFNNDGLVEAMNVVPVYGNYISAQYWANTGNEPVDEPYGAHSHFAGGSVWQLYLGSITKLYEYNTTTFGATDKTRLVGGAYATSAAGGEFGWSGASFGDAVVMTQYVDDPQLLTSPAAANFVKLAQSGGANPGMDPKAKFAWAQRGNMFLANLNLSAAFDGLPIGANPTVVAWSQTDNVRQYGSFNATPQLTGTGYQPISYDFGHITGGIGGDFGLVALQGGWVRIDGPPYVFRPIITGSGCRFSKSIVRFDRDIYYWGPSGPAVFRDGEGPPIILGDGRVARTLIDNAVTGFSPTSSISFSVTPRHVSASIDQVNGLIFWSFTSSGGTAQSRVGDLTVIYNVRDDRFSFMENSSAQAGVAIDKNGLLFLQSGPDLGGPWSPGRDLIGVLKYVDELAAVHYQVAKTDYGDIPSILPMLLTRGFQQIDPNRATRITRVRPIYSRSSVDTTDVTVTITSKNKPYDQGFTTSSTSRDAHGWITTPSSKLTDFHQVSVSIDGANLETLVEVEGFEIEYAKGGAYAT